MATITGRIQMRNDTLTNWRTENPILLKGEMGMETDTGNCKVGDGLTTWNSLPYAFCRNTNRSVEFIAGTQTASTASLTGATEDTGLYDGKCINYYLPYASKANATLNLTLADGSMTGAKPVYIVNATRLGTQYSAGSVFSMVYSATKDAWYCGNYYNSNTYDRILHNNAVYAATACTAKAVIVGTSAGYKNAAAGVSFDISYPVLYASAAIGAGKTVTSAYDVMPSVALTVNKPGWSGTTYAMAFLVGTITGNMFTIDDAVFTTTIPTTEDGKVYLPIGVCASTTTVFFHPAGQIFEYKVGMFRQYQQTYDIADYKDY